MGPGHDPISRRWVEQLRRGHPQHEQAVARLHEGLRRAALHELHRRPGPLRGTEFDDVAQQCADDAVVNVMAKLDEFRGLSRFTTWAYKFVIFEVSSKLARHAWQRHPPGAEDLEFEQLPDTLAATPGEHAERREQLATLTGAIEHQLTPRQREVFVAVGSPSTRCRSTSWRCSWSPTATRSTKPVRCAPQAARLPGRGRVPAERRGGRRMTDIDRLDALLRAQEGDAGCDAGVPIMDQYVEIELRGEDPAERFPGTAIHLRVCPGCRADHDGVLEAARRFGDFE